MPKLTLDGLVSQLQAALGSDLRAVAVYGSAASGDHVSKRSDVNVLVIVDALPSAKHPGVSAAMVAWSESGQSPPLLLTTDEWRGSSDIFAMEYADILERHRLLFGALPDGVRVDPHHLRLELEHEAMGTLLQLRRGWLAAGTDGRRHQELLEDSASALLALFRAVVRLSGATPPAESVALCSDVARLAGTDATPFVKAVNHRRGGDVVKPAQAAAVVAGCVEGLQRVVRYLDQFKGR